MLQLLSLSLQDRNEGRGGREERVIHYCLTLISGLATKRVYGTTKLCDYAILGDGDRRREGILCSPLLSGILVLSVGGSLPLPGPSGQGSGAEFEEDHFGIDVVLESWDQSTETGTSVDQPKPEPGHVPPAIQVAPRGNKDHVPGRNRGKSLFEVKAKIIRIMAVLDPTERGNIAFHKSEARLEPYCERDASRAEILEMRPFGEANSISSHQTLQLMRRPYGVKANVYVVTLSGFQRCLEDGPDAAERRLGSRFPTGRGIEEGHLKAHHDLQATPARPGKATRLGVRGSIVPVASWTSYSSFLKARGRDLFSTTEKKGEDLTRHNLMIHPIPMICA
ncbi:hypothetical protein HAX54_000102 [Datura stramonium]|uniref:Uncharacterized protein n=1 Tax=Datura stramonium TaxID=4076 RepID=A0ABS8RHH8_DATST|nr:hypothetical protein [Datura stramonium]